MRMKKKEANRGEEKEIKKRMERVVLKEGVTVLFLWRLLESSVEVRTWRDAVVFSWGCSVGEA